jgi:hypothetical protein
MRVMIPSIITAVVLNWLSVYIDRLYSAPEIQLLLLVAAFVVFFGASVAALGLEEYRRVWRVLRQAGDG